MTSPTNSKMYKFDKTGAVAQIGNLSSEKVIRLGGPLQLANSVQSHAIDIEKRKHDSEVPPGSLGDPLSKRRARNRKSTNSNSRGRKRHTKIMEELNMAVFVQLHSLSRAEEVLDKELATSQKWYAVTVLDRAFTALSEDLCGLLALPMIPNPITVQISQEWLGASWECWCAMVMGTSGTSMVATLLYTNRNMSHPSSYLNDPSRLPMSAVFFLRDMQFDHFNSWKSRENVDCSAQPPVSNKFRSHSARDVNAAKSATTKDFLDLRDGLLIGVTALIVPTSGSLATKAVFVNKTISLRTLWAWIENKIYDDGTYLAVQQVSSDYSVIVFQGDRIVPGPRGWYFLQIYTHDWWNNLDSRY